MDFPFNVSLYFISLFFFIITGGLGQLGVGLAKLLR